MVGKIFINYRRDDDPGYTQALYQRLEEEFASADLFMDVEGSIKPGDDFVEVLSTQVDACDVMLAVIGPRWSELLTDRVRDPADFVAIEIKTAFAMGKRVIPVLVGGASMPRADELPETIQPLARRNAVGLRPERFKADCQGLVAALKEQLADVEKEVAARTEAERTEAEANRLKREAEEAARIFASEERARAQRVAGMSPEDVRKAEELANWEFIKERDRPHELLDHLARFPKGVTTNYARAKLEELVWDGIALKDIFRGSSKRAAEMVAPLQAFLNEFPDGKYAGEARALLTDLERKTAEAKAADEQHRQETEAWGRVAASSEPGPIESFLSQWPKGQHATAARARIAELNRTLWTPRRATVLGAGVIVAFLLGAGAVAWRLEIQTTAAANETQPHPTQSAVERKGPESVKPTTEASTDADPAKRVSNGTAEAAPEKPEDDGGVIFKLAETFDPNVLPALGTQGISSDVVRAKELYRRALALGIAQAQMRLEALDKLSVGENITSGITAPPPAQERWQLHPPAPEDPAPMLPSPPASTPNGPTPLPRATSADAPDAPRSCLTPPTRALLTRLEERFGSVQVVSTCRLGATIAGTGRPSRHSSGNAVDFDAGSRKADIVQWLVANHHDGGTMTYPDMDHIHIDIGPHFVSIAARDLQRMRRAGGGDW
jgi:hypothetical protein